MNIQLFDRKEKRKKKRPPLFPRRGVNANLNRIECCAVLQGHVPLDISLSSFSRFLLFLSPFPPPSPPPSPLFTASIYHAAHFIRGISNSDDFDNFEPIGNDGCGTRREKESITWNDFILRFEHFQR